MDHILLMAFLDQGTFDVLWVVSPFYEKKKYEREHTVLISIDGPDRAIKIIGLLLAKGYERTMIAPP